MKRILPGLVGVALVSGCSVERAAKLLNGTGAPVAMRVAAFERGRASGHQDMPVAPGRSVRLGGSQLQAAVGLSQLGYYWWGFVAQGFLSSGREPLFLPIRPTGLQTKY